MAVQLDIHCFTGQPYPLLIPALMALKICSGSELKAEVDVPWTAAGNMKKR